MPVCAMPNSDGFLAVVPELEVSSCTGYVMMSAEEYDFRYGLYANNFIGDGYLFCRWFCTCLCIWLPPNISALKPH